MTLKRIIPLSVFRQRVNSILDELRDSEETLMVTIRGRGQFVVQTLDKFAEIEELAHYGNAQLAVENALKDRKDAGAGGQ